MIPLAKASNLRRREQFLESVPCKEHLPDVYRFAFLMTGSGEAAAEVLRRTVERAARGGVGDLRDPRRARRWLFAEARHHCNGPLTANLPSVPVGTHEPNGINGTGDRHTHTARDASTPAPSDLRTLSGQGISDPCAGSLAGAFLALPERERSALILFYLYLFDLADLAETLELKPDTLGPILVRARALLARELDKPLPVMTGTEMTNDQ